MSEAIGRRTWTPSAGRSQSAPPLSTAWPEFTQELEARGVALLPGLVAADTCDALANLYADDSRFRDRIVMSRHGFGRGEYKYFTYPLPPVVARLRTELYPHLAGIANRWNELIGVQMRFPPSHSDFIRRCREGGQSRPTPLLLRYGEGDYNCLHQDLYGELVFPLQVTVLLSRPGEEFQGGEFVLTEQRPRMQSWVQVVPLLQGDAALFPVQWRPVRGGARGVYRVNMRHGVSRIHGGRRYTLGIIFHDAR